MALLQSKRYLRRLLAVGLLFAIASGGRAIAQTEDLDTLRKQAAELYQTGKYAESLPLAQRVLTTLEEKLGPDHAEVGDALNTLGLIYWSQGRYADAEPIYRRAIAVAEATSGTKDWTTGARLNNLAILLNAQGRYDESDEIYKRTRSIAEAVFGAHHTEVARVLTNSALVYWKQGRFAEAEVLCKRALAIRESALGPKHPDVAHTLNALALVNSDQGRYTDAEPLAKRALAIEEAAFGPNHPNMVSRLNNLGDIYRLEGRYGEAEPLYKRALAVAGQIGNDDFVRSILNNLAWLYWVQGRYGEAEPLYKSSLNVAERMLGADHPDLLAHLHNLAAIYRVQGRATDAEPLLNRARAIGEKAGGNHLHFAKALNNLALVYQDQGRYAEAEAFFERALATAEKVLGPNHPDFGVYLSNLGALQAAQGNWREAATLLKRGTDIAIARLKRTAEALGRPQTGAVASEAERPGEKLALLVKVLARLASQLEGRNEDVAARMFEVAQWARGSEAAASLGQMAARQAKGDTMLARIVRERQDLASEWQSRDKLLIAAVSQPPEKRNAAAETALRDRLAAIDRRIAEIDKALAKDFPEYAALSNPEPLSFEEAQAQLRPDEALVLILDTPKFKPMPEETFIWVVTKTDSRWVRSDLGTKALQEGVAALRCGLDRDGEWKWSSQKDRWVARKPPCAALRPNGLTRSEPLPFDLAKAYGLYKGLLGEVKELIKDKHLLLVPSGALTSLPFQVFVTAPPTGDNVAAAAWLIRVHALTVLPSVASLAALRRNAKVSAAPDPFIGFGNPLLTRSCGLVYIPDKCPDDDIKVTAAEGGVTRSAGPLEAVGDYFRGGLADVAVVKTRLCPLPDTAHELACVARSLGADPKSLVLGKDMTETAVKKLPLDRYRIVHFATHGLLAGQTARYAKNHAEPALVFSPPDTATEEDDGLLTASEVAGLKLDADWVVMSACNTASGAETGAEALSGLAKAFFYAGARAVLVSHWPVNSYAATMLTSRTFAEIKKDPAIGRSEGFRRAMLALMSNRDWPWAADPSVWAPFVVVGEGGAQASH